MDDPKHIPIKSDENIPLVDPRVFASINPVESRWAMRPFPIENSMVESANPGPPRT